MPTFPAKTITSAKLAPLFSAIGANCESTFAKRTGSFPCQSFCGANLIRAPLAPPRLSEPLNVRALSHAVETKSATEILAAAIAALTSATLYDVEPLGIGSCQIKSSAGTSGPM